MLQRWVIPMEATTVGVEEFLPAGVVLRDGDFEIGVPPASVSASLGELCSACGPLDGLFVSDMPPFTGQIETTQALPGGIEGATVIGGSIVLSIENGLSFDPIEPHPTEGGGRVTLRVSDASSGAVLGEVVLDGDVVSLSPGATVSRVIDLSAVSVGSSLRIRAEVVSEGGQSATIDLSEEITVTLSSATLVVSSLTFDVGTTDVALESVSLDVDEFDAELTDRIREGAIVLDMTNPFAVSVDAELQVGPTSKSFTIDPVGTSTVAVSYTGDELRSFLGRSSVTLSGSGTATGGSITVTPDQEILVAGDLDVTIEIGGEADSAFIE